MTKNNSLDNLYLQCIIEAGRDGIWDWDLISNKAWFDPCWKRLLGFDEEEIGSSPEEWLERIHADDVERVRNTINSHIENRTHNFISEHRIQDKEGNYRWVFCRGGFIFDEMGKPVRFVGMMTDFSDTRVANEQLRHEAFYDSLTELPNRVVFKDRIGRSLERTKRRNDYIFAVIFMDLNRFKAINDGLGHEVGDQLLVETGERLKNCLRGTDTVARLGGDEFGLLLEEIRDVSDSIRVAERVEQELVRPFIINTESVYTSASLGIALSSSGYETVDNMLRDADIAMYRAKADETRSYQIVDETMQTRAVQRLTLENKLREAINKDQFVLYYQPIYNLQQRKLVGFEALVRWNNPEMGMVSPGDFIPVAEETGIITEIDRVVADKACKKLSEWRCKYQGAEDLNVSVNFSRRNFTSTDLISFVQSIIEENELPPGAFRAEVTESQIMEEAEVAQEVLEHLRSLNVLLHMDDFGKGYSSLSYLVRFNMDTLKIDGSFVSNMDVRGENFEIIRMIVSLAHNLGMKVIAEGIETSGQLEQLRRLKCEYGQGYYLNYPMPAYQIEKHLLEPAAFDSK